jgi:alpha-mannosidase
MLHNFRWTSGKIKQRLALIEPLAYRCRHRLPLFRYQKLGSPLEDPPVSPDVDDRHWQTISWGSHWGGSNTDFVLRSRFQIPPEWATDGPVALYLPLGEAGDFSHPEALAYIDGEPYASCDRHHQEIELARRWVDGASHLLALHGWTGGTQSLHFGASGDAPISAGSGLLMHPCEVVQIDQATREFVALGRVALGVADCLDENEPSRAHLYNALDHSFKVLDTREPPGPRFYASVLPASARLREDIARSGVPLDVDITAIGHAHIDMAWLWTLGQTRRKAGRTFHSVLRLMERFPDFRFSQSQPQLYDFVRQDYPELFDSICQLVSEGRWEAVGGMWVEPDCNLSGGESLARQFLLGLSFFRQHFGERGETPVLWLPDAFGYAWNLPQLIKEAGLKYFFTIKMGWNQYNRLPYDSFWWQGLDGTRILTHFSPTKGGDSDFASTHNAMASAGGVLRTWTNFQQKDWGDPGLTPPLLMAYGYGDGGGGPTREMLENIRELRAFPAMPRVRCGMAADFFHDLETCVSERLPTWNGELYLEYHRGTLTSQARNKRANRKSEFLLHDAEFLASVAATLEPGYAYPHQALSQAWQLVCLNQFHDILPGSSIGPVYVESQQQYAQIRALGDAVRQGALTVIGDKKGGDLLVANATSFSRRDLAFWPGQGPDLPPLRRADGSRAGVQPVEGGLLLDVGELPPYSITGLCFVDGLSGEAQAEASLIAGPDLLENGTLRVEFNDCGDIVRIFDKRNRREVLPAATIANRLEAFEDRPRTPDAWDIDIYYDDRMWQAEPADSIRVVERGPLRASLELRRQVLNSRVVQHISLAHNSARLDFSTTVQWHERHIMLKVAFPVDVLSPVATYEIQWGNVQRPTHRNTSWDWARFETCAHKWVDLSEGGYGASLLNDCKYGHDIHDNVMRLTLLRSPTDPDPKADLGEHRFVYSLLPHAGGWGEFTVSQAYALNDPLIVWARGEPRTAVGEERAKDKERAAESHALATGSFVRVDPPNMVIETVKRAEDGQGLIVRLYESQRQRGEFELATSFPLAKAWRTNLIEENQEPLKTDKYGVRCFAKPYQIVTLRLLPG